MAHLSSQFYYFPVRPACPGGEYLKNMPVFGLAHLRGLPGTNTLGYLDTLSVMKESSYIIVTPGVNVEEIVIFITDAPDNYDAVFP